MHAAPIRRGCSAEIDCREGILVAVEKCKYASLEEVSTAYPAGRRVGTMQHGIPVRVGYRAEKCKCTSLEEMGVRVVGPSRCDNPGAHDGPSATAGVREVGRA